jgi:hypothetical protein
MKSMRLITQSLFAVLVLAIASGCAHTVSVKQTPLAGGRVLPHHAALVLNQEFTDYKHKMVLIGGSDTYPMGTALQDYARNVTAKSFQHIEVASSAEQAASLISDDLILIPRVVKSDNSLSKFIPFVPQKLTMTLVVEWTAKNRASQNTVWLKTTTANATAAAHRRGKLFQKLFDDLNLKTYTAFQEAPELRGGQP